MKIFLIGFMGSGKTYWGRLWSQQNDIDFFDLDEMIEQHQKKTIIKIFEEEGEAIFRNIETETLKIFTENNNCIIACGGGTPCYNDNMHWMNENGITVYLSASPQYIYNRVIEEKDRRPLIRDLNNTDLLLYIEQKLKEREPIYKQAELIFQVEELNAASFQKIIICNL